jgi:hypothetical protein
MTIYEPTPAPPEIARWRSLRRRLSNRLTGWIVAAGLACAVLGLSIALALSSSAAAAPALPASGSGGGPAAAGGFGSGGAGFGSGGAGSASGGAGSNARSGPAPGGTIGTVGTVSTSSFTLSTSTGQKVTVNEASSTTYEQGTTAASASAVTTGAPVLVLGTVNSTTITATDVIVQPTGYSSSSAAVVPFQQGAPSTSKQVGQIPANYSQGSGTIVTGTAANKATEAALAAYPGGVVDRVVQLSNGEYEVHNIGVNWPHHVFVDQNFKVVGAN